MRRSPSFEMAAVPAGALVLPRSYVERAAVQKVADGLIKPEEPRAPYAVVGMGGGGKTMLVSAVVRKSNVRQHFRGGIFWMTVGRGAKNRLLPLLQGLAREMSAALTDAPHEVPQRLELIRQHLTAVASTDTSPRLVVLDDVWEREVVDALLSLGLKVLVTTRDRSVVGIPGGWVKVGDMEQDEALELLLKTSSTFGSQPGDDARAQMMKVVALCGHLPLALAIAGSMPVVRGKGLTASAWEEVIKVFENVAKMMAARGEQSSSLKMVFEASFDALSERKQEEVLKTAVLAAGAIAPIDMLLNLWETEDLEGTREEAEGLVSKCLLQDLGDDGYCVPDVTLKYLKIKIRAEKEMVEKATALQAQYLRRLHVLKSYGNPEHGAGKQDLFVLDALWRSVEELSGDRQLEVASYRVSLGELESSEANANVASCYSSVGCLFNTQGKYSDAEPLHKRAQEILETLLGPNHPDVATALDNRAESLKRQAKYGQAEPLYLRATGIFERSLGPDHLTVASSFNSRAEVLEAQGKLEEAELLYLRAIAIQEMVGPEHPRLADSLVCRASLLQAQGKIEEADLLYLRAIAMQEAVLGPNHPSLATSLVSRASLWQEQGMLQDAEPLVQRAIAIQETALGPEHPSLAISLVCRGSILQGQGKPEDAEILFLRAIEFQEKALGRYHPSLANSFVSRAKLLQEQNRQDEAERLYLRATGIFERSLGPDHPKVTSSLTSRAELLEAQGKNIQAGQLRERVRAIKAKVRKKGFRFINEENLLFAKEAPSGVDRLDYDVYAAALAGLFGTGEADVLPAAVGIYAQWGSGKSFLLDHLKSRLKANDSRPSLCTACCCCLGGLKSMAKYNVVAVIVWTILQMLLAWLCSCYDACRKIPKRVSSDHEAGREEVANGGTDFVVVEFNAWECAGLEILWAVVTTKIFDAVEEHTAFGRGAVRAARIKKLLKDPSWNWCSLATFYFTVALLGIVAVLVLNATGALDGINQVVRDVQWAVATLLLPGVLSLLNILVQMSSRGSFRTAHSALRKAMSNRDSVGDAYLGFMSEVKEELEILFDMINAHNKEVRMKAKDEKHIEEEVDGGSDAGEGSEPDGGSETDGGSEADRGRGANDEAKPKKNATKAKNKTLALAVIVDDLDRCSKEKIMAMLQATHLLLEQPEAPMAVFLAVDPQLIVSAIAESLEGAPNTMKALQYLDKIIHLPFCIPTLSAPKRLDLLDSLLNGGDNSCRKTLKRVKEFLNGAPSDTDLKKHEEKISEWCVGPDELLGKAELELVCTLRWWSKADSTALRWREQLKYALKRLRAVLGEDSEVAWETRRVACLKVLEALCKTINVLMITQAEESSQAAYTAITLKRVKKSLDGDAPSEDDLKASEMTINEWCPTTLLEIAELELVSTLYWWTQAGSVAPLWREQLEDALDRLRAALGEISEPAWETKRAACLKLLEALCGTINTLMSTQFKKFFQADNSVPSRAESPSAGAGGGAAPVSDREIPPDDGHGAPVSRPPSRTHGEGGWGGSDEFKAATGDGVNGTPVSVPRREGSLGSFAVGGTSSLAPPTASPQTFNRAISMDENDTFRALFRIVHATPRKIKRVVNVYFLHRSVAKNTEWWEKKDSKTREQELVTWTILAEFWPFRLSCIAFAMTNEAPEGKPSKLNYAGNSTIASVYGGSAGDPSTSVCKWIDNYRGKGIPKDLFLSDDTEGRFQAALQAGAQITKHTVTQHLLHNSFNLNPALMKSIEVEMVYDLPQTAESELVNGIQSLLAKLE